MTARDCLQSPLVEALHDGRLGPPERASVERHLTTCASCRDLARDLNAIRSVVRAPREAASELVHQRARQSLLGRASVPPQIVVRPSLRGRAIISLAAAFAVAIWIGWLGGRATAPLLRPELAVCAPTPKAPFETSVRPSEGALFEHARSPGLDVVTLSRGALDVRVRPSDPRERFVVRTADAEILAHRASFRVEAHQGRIRSVAVESESVEVRYAGAVVVMTSGASWRPGDPADAAARLEVAAPEPPVVTLPEAVAPALPANVIPAPNDRAAPAPHSEASARSPDRSPITESASKSARERDTRRSATAASKSSRLAALTAPSVPASREERATQSSAGDFAAAMQAIAAGDYLGGAARLEAFAATYPTDPRADEAGYVRAAALQRAGRAAEAAAAARRYLALRPDGSHRVEAAKIADERAFPVLRQGSREVP